MTTSPPVLKIGFLLTPGESWLGGVNYYSNLFRAVAACAEPGVQLLAFFPRATDAALVHQICGDLPCVTVIRTRLLDRGSLPWYGWQVSRRLFGSDLWVALALRRHRVDLFSHAWLYASRLVPSASWIPDFQHLHLPQFFSAQELASRNRTFQALARRSTVVILSSETAADDFRRFAPDQAHKARVLRFVSQVPASYWSLTATDEAELRHRHALPRPYIYLPNQFWPHKNHVLAIEALQVLLSRGLAVDLVCTGTHAKDRNGDHMAQIHALIERLGLQGRVRLLGLVPHADVYALIRYSACVVNPSLFEGWSTTVEECKSVGKPMVLSDLPVHREQDPAARFFDPHDPASLADALHAVLAPDPAAPPPTDDPALAARQSLAQRVLDYGRSYLALARAVIHPASRR